MKPCSLCGEDAAREYGDCIVCMGCGAYTDDFEYLAQAAEAWDRGWVSPSPIAEALGVNDVPENV